MQWSLKVQRTVLATNRRDHVLPYSLQQAEGQKSSYHKVGSAIAPSEEYSVITTPESGFYWLLNSKVSSWGFEEGVAYLSFFHCTCQPPGRIIGYLCKIHRVHLLHSRRYGVYVQISICAPSDSSPLRHLGLSRLPTTRRCDCVSDWAPSGLYVKCGV